jgi:hypothetical protein
MRSIRRRNQKLKGIADWGVTAVRSPPLNYWAQGVLHAFGRCCGL